MSRTWYRIESLPRLIAAHGVGGWVGRREVGAGIQCKVPKRDRTGLLLVARGFTAPSQAFRYSG
eukprot:scaffold48024_cov57-Phaeocystis_antarctica.AAC.10